jgi:hypothetical protein
MIRIINEKGFDELHYIVVKRSPHTSEVLEDYSFTFNLGSVSLRREFFTYNAVTATVTAKKGYQWDEATGLPSIQSLVRPSLLHDVTIQALESLNIYPNHVREAHRLFREDCVNCGVPSYIAHPLYWGLILLYPIHRKRNT